MTAIALEMESAHQRYRIGKRCPLVALGTSLAFLLAVVDPINIIVVMAGATVDAFGVLFMGKLDRWTLAGSQFR